MRVSRRDVLGNFDDMWRQMERFVEHGVGDRRPPVMFTRTVWQPNVDICENAEQVVVLLELAGVRREEIEISVDGLVLCVRGIRRDAVHGRKQRVYVLEINFGLFERILPLPAPVDAEAASAAYEDGFLEIVLPKAREPRPRKIEIIAS
ncbi:MAG: Hsp20/alpha crystallin family protein [Chloroflexi bacterium]|nr:Hsp20/alpha crystallin family protein [Chloroflexota bacterium]